jgi:hypothetical protein
MQKWMNKFCVDLDEYVYANTNSNIKKIYNIETNIKRRKSFENISKV